MLRVCADAGTSPIVSGPWQGDLHRMRGGERREQGGGRWGGRRREKGGERKEEGEGDRWEDEEERGRGEGHEVSGSPS